MPVNDFLAYATAGGANVVDQATYAAAGYVTVGRSSGILPSNVYNKIARQGNFGTAALGKLINNLTGLDALDDGDLTTFVTNLTAAIAAASPSNATTGDAKLTLKSTADSGWLLMNDGTIGNASSGAGYANVAAQALFALLWNNVSNTYAPTYNSSGTPVSRGVSAAADWAANCRIALTQQLGRAIIIAGAGSGLTSRSLGQTLGEETHLLVLSEIPSHIHSASASSSAVSSVSDPGHSHPGNLSIGGNFLVGAPPTAAAYPGGSDYNTGSAVTGISVSTSVSTSVTVNANGGSGAHNNMQPSSAWNIMIKL